VVINDLSLMERDVVALVIPYELVLCVPRGFCFCVNDLQFELIRVFLNGCP
jgi:hypothetical protein